MLISLFFVFFFIGVYNFGGGYAMVPLIISLVVDKYGWVSISEFINFLTISQITPGPIAINLATFVGYTVGNGVLGSIITTLAVVLPSFIIITLIVLCMKKFKDNEYVKNFFIGIRPVVLGLIATSCISVIDSDFYTIYSFVSFSIIFYLTTYKKLHPIIAIFLTGFIGMWIV
ncbi:MAG: chromate transporter [Peptoniphilaceae bacterium]|uniref:chromate transporter n=1 Tax=Parvimonas sp. TaxID=1944660 RepID=UPI0025FC3A07|nr:chromate transporter [Parvimonas sp.]MCI5996988.1 chromate transporter [Parvimonas sp.]MDD7765074.1 chromate transporter [Peptoniphilaceae bacterium]MDY3050242.1 chromate transporter [Parvimonas sp.]